ncbi:TlpA disulfide reductase family protein [Streptomyces macrosporus]|uniref:Thioredoxin domain-containing protein n=1 Tax=Streptomyces macrosporus TaxID=44032 RepID=A0ABN3KET6_9ACTN
MPVLITIVAVVGVLGVLNLVLALGMIRRLKEHTEVLSNLSGRGSLALGEEVGAFTSTTVDGESVTREALAGDTLVGFFSPSCAPCREQLPKFVAYARQMPGGRGRVLAAVVGQGPDAEKMLAELGEVARVVAEKPGGGALSAAFQAIAFPTVLRVSPGDRGVPVVTDDRVDLDRPVLTLGR